MTATTGTASPYYGQPQNVGRFYNLPDTTNGISVKTGEGVLYSITFNKPVATGVVTLYDGTSTGGAVIATITIPSSPQPVTLIYDVFFATGLFVSVATAAQDLTITYR